MNSTQILENLKDAMVQIDVGSVVKLTQDTLAQNINPLDVIEKGLSPGMLFIGDKFNRGECYLPELIRAAETFNKAMELLEPEIMKRGEKQTSSGIVVLGTVKGDIHSIGKDILGMLLKTRGFEIHDLGVDVASSAFLNKAEEHSADIIAMSSLLTTTMPGQKEVIDLLKDKMLREKYIVMVGGGPVNQNWAGEIEADGYADTAEEAVRLAEELISAQKV